MSPAPATSSCHVVAIPYAGRGHVNPMMNLCKLLSNTQPKLKITFVITEEWFGLIGSEEKPENITLATIPNVLPSEKERAKDMLSFVGAIQTKMEEPFEELMDRFDEPVTFIIADTFLDWAVEFGERKNIPVASLWPMPASVFSIFYHFELLEKNGHHPFDVSERGEERVNYMPGIDSIRLMDIPSIAYDQEDLRLLRLALRIFPNVHRAQYLLFTSIYELEHQVIEALKQEFSFPLYTFGPAIPYFTLDKVASFSTNQKNHPHYFEWLNIQPQSSVLYISLGSFLSVSNAQMDEIAIGLRESGVRFLWVARGEASRLKKICGNEGLVVSWCEQLKMLLHPSIGGFWTHCGWNSAMEGIFAGLPMITFPILLDQTTVRKHVVEDWMIGVDAQKYSGGDKLLRSGEISKLVKKFMDLESNERKEMATRAKELGEVTHRAISDGGSSKNNLKAFLEDVMSFN